MGPIAVLHDNPDECRDLLEARFPALEFHYASATEEILPVLERANPEAVLSIKHPGFRGPGILRRSGTPRCAGCTSEARATSTWSPGTRNGSQSPTAPES